MYVCSCFGITEAQVDRLVDTGRVSPRAIAGACGAGTDCGSCVRRIQALLGQRVDRSGRPATSHEGAPVAAGTSAVTVGTVTAGTVTARTAA